MPARVGVHFSSLEKRRHVRSAVLFFAPRPTAGFKNSRASVIATARRPNAARADFRLVPRGRAETRASWTTTSPRG
jgi:hypothetical protein